MPPFQDSPQARTQSAPLKIPTRLNFCILRVVTAFYCPLSLLLAGGSKMRNRDSETRVALVEARNEKPEEFRFRRAEHQS